MGEADVEKQAFHQAGKHDERLEQGLVGLGCAGMEVRVHDRFNERDQELVFVADGFDFVVGAENFAFVQAQRFDDVLVCVGVDRLFKRLTQQKLAAFRRRDVAVCAQHNVVGGQRIGCRKEAQVALNDAALVLGQTVGIFPQSDVTGHIDLLRHPVVGTGREVFFPGPFVLKGNQLIDVSLAVDDTFVRRFDTPAGVVGKCHSGSHGGTLKVGDRRCGRARGRCKKSIGRIARKDVLRGGLDFFFPGQHRFFSNSQIMRSGARIS